MTTTRILPAVLAAVLATSGPVWGQQFRMPSYSPPGNPGYMPALGSSNSPLSSYGLPATAQALPPPPQAAGDPLTRIATSGNNPSSDPVNALMSPPGMPPGSYGSPYYADSLGCGGPSGHSGTIDYDVYGFTGPSFAFGSGAFTDRLHLGFMIGGGARTLFFNQAGDAAWAFDLGLNYIYNRGSNDDFIDLFTRRPPLQGANNLAIPQSDVFQTVRIRGLDRSALNFGIGRDWFTRGNGVPGGEEGWNFRWGTDVGGRWGTAHVDMVPLDDPSGYSRRQKTFHGLYLGFHANYEVPMGGWIAFVGFRTQWSYDWMNIVPPIKGDVQSVNVLLTGGIRF
ncbi:MAG TPA: hypothetical protein VN641_02265 [Urbifossiella sp.]|nr:hypothetical protein [Urbifossiella sp.]